MKPDVDCVHALVQSFIIIVSFLILGNIFISQNGNWSAVKLGAVKARFKIYQVFFEIFCHLTIVSFGCDLCWMLLILNFIKLSTMSMYRRV